MVDADADVDVDNGEYREKEGKGEGERKRRKRVVRAWKSRVKQCYENTILGYTLYYTIISYHIPRSL